MKTPIVILLVVFVSYSCNKKVTTLLPGPADAEINFYNAAEVLVDSSQFERDNYVFIDDTSSTHTNNYVLFPGSIGDARQAGGYLGDGIGNDPSGYQRPIYLRLPAGNHRFLYTGPGKYVLGDSTIFMPIGSKTCLYLSESPEQDNAYRILSVPEDWIGIAGKMRVRLIDLSTDAGTFRCYQEGRGEQAVVSQLHYGEATPYMVFDTTGTAQTRNQLVLRLFTGRDTSNVLLSAGIPVLPGASFAVVIQGFVRPARRSIRTGTGADGKPVYTSITVRPNLRINLRRTY